MGLAQTGATVDEERVVVSPGLLGDRHRRRPGESVGLADHEALESIAGDEIRRRGLPGDGPMVWIGSSLERERLLDDGVRLDNLVVGPGLMPESVPIGAFDQVAVLVAQPTEAELAVGDAGGGLLAD